MKNQNFIFLIISFFGMIVGAPVEPVSAFELIYTPARIVKHVTRDVILRCDDDAGQISKLKLEISRIRMLKKTSTGWDLVAERRDNEDSPEVLKQGVAVEAEIGHSARDTFIQLKWRLATAETYGTYMCDVIGFDRDNYNSAIEVASEVTVEEQNVNAEDLLEVVREMKTELDNQALDIEAVKAKVQELQG